MRIEYSKTSNIIRAYNPFFWNDLTVSTMHWSNVLYFKPKTSIDRLLLYLYKPLSGVPSG
jgi:hypothetical protein